MGGVARAGELDGICRYLPERLKNIVGRIKPEFAADLEEIRFNAGLPAAGVFAGYDRFIGEDGDFAGNPEKAFRAAREDMEDLFFRLCEHSVYAYQEDIARGFITLQGGYRAGICGRVVYQGESVKSIKDISSVCIRVTRQKKGCAEGIFPYIRQNDRDIYNTLIISPPRCGKTTVLRDLCRIISTGFPDEGFIGLRTAVVDERSEIAACYRGVAQNDCGPRTDVLDGCRKPDGIEIALRGMSPSVIIMDELGAKGDAESIKAAWNAGVRIVATAHAYGLDDVRDRPGLGSLVCRGGFRRFVILGICEGKRWIKVLDTDGTELFNSDKNTGLRHGIRGMYGFGAEIFGKAEREAACHAEAQGHAPCAGK